MATTYAKNKQHIYKWRLNNMEKNREQCRKCKRKFDQWQRIKKEFLGILLD